MVGNHDWAAVIVAVMGTGGLGGGLRFLWNKVEKRFELIEGKLEACQERETASNQINAVQLTVIELLWNDLKKLQPKSGTLARAHKLLEDLKMLTKEEQKR